MSSIRCADHAEGIATVSKSGYPVRVFKSGGLEALIETIQDFAPSVVINDLPLVEETYLRALARLGAITINLVDTLEDLERVSRDAQFVISVMNEDRETPEGFYGGPAFAILRRHFQGRERASRAKPLKVLHTFGGADPQALTVKVARALAPLAGDIEVISVAGPAFPHTPVFEALRRTLGKRLPLISGICPVPRTVLKPVTVTSLSVSILITLFFCGNAVKTISMGAADKIVFNFITQILHKETVGTDLAVAISGNQFTHLGKLPGQNDKPTEI